MSDPLGKPKWIEKRTVTRSLLKVFSLAAGLCLAAAGGVWGWMSPEDATWKRLLVVIIGLLLGMGLTIYLWWYIGRYY